MDGSLFSLKWNNHKSTFFHNLSALRDNDSFSDATLVCEEKFYPVHQLVLSTCSDYFYNVFKKINSVSPVIILKDVSSIELESLLDYMYLGQVEVKQNELATLIKSAECLKIKGLAVSDEKVKALNVKEETKLSNPFAERFPNVKRKILCNDKSDLNISSQIKNSVQDLVSQAASSHEIDHNTINEKLVTEKSENTNLYNFLVPSRPLKLFKKSSMTDFKNIKSKEEKEDDVRINFDDTCRNDQSTSAAGISGINNETYWTDKTEEGLTNVDDEQMFGSFSEELLGDSPPRKDNALPNNLNIQIIEKYINNPPSDIKAATLTATAVAVAGQTQHDKTLFHCPFCNKASRRRDHLRLHIRTHTNERPYACALCPHRACQKSDLKRHMRKHDKNNLVLL